MRNHLFDPAVILIIHVGTSATAVECSDLTSRLTGLCGGRTNMAMTNLTNMRWSMGHSAQQGLSSTSSRSSTYLHRLGLGLGLGLGLA